MKKLLIIMLLAATVAQAETYKWTDNEGTVHFSDSQVDLPRNAKPASVDSQSGGSYNSSGKAVKPAESRKGAGGQTTIPAQIEGLKERIQNDGEIMNLVRSLQDDPEMRAILEDPSVLGAVQAGDVDALVANPAFMKILNNPRIREIGRKLGVSGE